jgi:hypothetical protein
MAFNLADLNRRRAGWLAKKSGSAFEQRVEMECLKGGLSFVEIPDGCRRFSRTKIVQVQTPFDCILGFGNQVACLDLKSINAGTFGKSLVSAHQVDALAKIHRHQIAGYLIYFRAVDKIVFFDAKELADLKDGTSLRHDGGVFVGDSLIWNLPAIFKDKGS